MQRRIDNVCDVSHMAIHALRIAKAVRQMSQSLRVSSNTLREWSAACAAGEGLVDVGDNVLGALGFAAV
jgi:hypothetical protein